MAINSRGVEVFILYWKFETIPADLDESHFYLGLAQLNGATTPTKLRNAIAKEKKENSRRATRPWMNF